MTPSLTGVPYWKQWATRWALSIVLALACGVLAAQRLGGAQLCIGLTVLFLCVAVVAMATPYAFVFLASSLIWGNAFTLLVSHAVPLTVSTAGAFKILYALVQDGPIWLACVSQLWTRRLWTRPEARPALGFLAFGALLLLSGVGRLPFTARLGSFKGILDFPALYLAGQGLANQRNRAAVVRLSRAVLWVALLYSVIDQVLWYATKGQGSLTQILGYDHWFNTLLLANNAIYGIGNYGQIHGLPGNFGFGALPVLGLGQIFRTGSIIFDPVAMSYLGFGLYLGASLGGQESSVTSGTLVSLLSLGKGGVLSALITVLSREWSRLRKVGPIVLVAGVPILAGGTYVGLHSTASIGNHIAGLVAGLRGLSVLGHGFGTAGNLAVMVSSAQGLGNAGPGESLLGVMAVQMGLVGLILAIWFVSTMVADTLRAGPWGSPPVARLVAIFLVVGSLTGLLTQGAWQADGLGYTALLAGVLVGARRG